MVDGRASMSPIYIHSHCEIIITLTSASDYFNLLNMSSCGLFSPSACCSVIYPPLIIRKCLLTKCPKWSCDIRRVGKCERQAGDLLTWPPWWALLSCRSQFGEATAPVNGPSIYSQEHPAWRQQRCGIFNWKLSYAENWLWNYFW